MSSQLTPADMRIIAATLDSCWEKSDDQTVEDLTITLIDEAAFAAERARRIAYTIVRRWARYV